MFSSTKPLCCFLLGATFFSGSLRDAGAIDISVENNSSVSAKLYSNTGSGWNLEGSIPARSQPQTISTSPGIEWGFSDPNATRVDIVQKITVRSFGFNTLKLNDSDLQGGSGGLFGRNITVRNNSSQAVKVYSKDGSGWNFVQTLLRNAPPKQFPVNGGDDWGIDDPTRSGINIIEQTTISNLNLFPSLTVNDADFGAGNPQGKTVTVTNNCSQSLKLFSDDGSGPQFKAMIASRAPAQNFTGNPGETWGFDDPNQVGTQFAKQIVVRSFGFNNLTIADPDLPGNNNANTRTLKMRNNTSNAIDVYSDTGGGWSREGTISSGGHVPFSAPVGSEWGFDDPARPGVNIVKQTTCRAFGFNDLTIADSDLRGSGSVGTRNLQMTNNSSQLVTVYSNDGSGWNREGTIRAGSGGPFPGTVGDDWGFDDPTRSGVNIVKQTTCRAFGLNSLSISDRDFNSQVGPNQGVTITFKNDNRSLVGYIYESHGFFDNNLLGTVSPGGTKNLTIRPGTEIKIKQDSPRSIAKFTVPTHDDTFSFQ